MKILKILKILFQLLLCTLIASSCKDGERLYKKSTILMDTVVTITVSSESKENAESAIDSAFERIKEIEGLINFWSPRSEVSALNSAAGREKVKVSPVTLDMVEKALYISRKTEGGFDATIGPIIRLYDFKKKTKPSDSSIKEKLTLIGFRNVFTDKNKSTVYLGKKGMSFDTGGIAKGYAADVAVEVLKRKGIKGGIVAVSGDIKTFGLKPDGLPWLVGIKNPRPKSKDDEIMATIELQDSAISTSGDYERFFMENGRRYHHIIDPMTGIPASGCQSVSVISKEGALSDGFSTGIFVMGPERGMRLLRELGFDGIIIDTEGKIYVTEGIKDKVNWHKKP
ncbi:MAG: FAD:protein FMN transferase [Nitrospirae bacterium]|nr:FAD:protein FMN transferase [Nitrospirota bacterium]